LVGVSVLLGGCSGSAGTSPAVPVSAVSSGPPQRGSLMQALADVHTPAHVQHDLTYTDMAAVVRLGGTAETSPRKRVGPKPRR
jgi:hypothetical protein